MHSAARPFSRACASAGSNIEARIAMIAITTNSSMSVKADRTGVRDRPMSWADGLENPSPVAGMGMGIDGEV